MAPQRARLLKELLALINAYGAHSGLQLGDYVEFGLPQESDDDRLWGEVIDSIAEFTSSLEAKTRTTTWTRTVHIDVARFGARVCDQLNAMSEPARASLIRALKNVAESNSESVAALLVGTPHIVSAVPLNGVEVARPDDESREDGLDRHYSGEVLNKLDLIIQRALRLTHIQLGIKSELGRDLESYFNEAHQCYLYGFPVACTVLCRAILEAALKLKVPGKFEDLGERIEAAHEKGLLSQPSRVWAYQIRDFGNNAIHQYERFARGDLAFTVQECLLKTRGIVEELFSV